MILVSWQVVCKLQNLPPYLSLRFVLTLPTHISLYMHPNTRTYTTHTHKFIIPFSLFLSRHTVLLFLVSSSPFLIHRCVPSFTIFVHSLRFTCIHTQKLINGETTNWRCYVHYRTHTYTHTNLSSLLLLFLSLPTILVSRFFLSFLFHKCVPLFLYYFRSSLLLYMHPHTEIDRWRDHELNMLCTYCRIHVHTHTQLEL